MVVRAADAWHVEVHVHSGVVVRVRRAGMDLVTVEEKHIASK